MAEEKEVYRLQYGRWWASLERGQPSFPPLPANQLQNTIEVRTSPRYADPIFLREQYLEKGLSAAQIGSLTFSSKKTVLKCLRKHKIRIRTEDLKRCSRYGLRVHGGSAKPHKRALRVQYKIVALRREGISYQRIAQTLNRLGYTPSRKTIWHAASVRRVFIGITTATKLANTVT